MDTILSRVSDSNISHLFLIDGDNVKNSLFCIKNKPNIAAIWVWNGYGKSYLDSNIFSLRAHTKEKQSTDITISVLAGKLDAILNPMISLYIVTDDHFANDILPWISYRRCLWISPGNI